MHGLISVDYRARNHISQYAGNEYKWIAHSNQYKYSQRFWFKSYHIIRWERREISRTI